MDRLAIFTSMMNFGTDTYVSLIDSERPTSSVCCLDQHITRRLSMAASRPSRNRKRPHQEEESDGDLHQPQWEEQEKTSKREGAREERNQRYERRRASAEERQRAQVSSNSGETKSLSIAHTCLSAFTDRWHCSVHSVGKSAGGFFSSAVRVC